MRKAEASQLLGVRLRDISRETVESAFKKRLREVHPDAGGDGGDMARLKKARDLLLIYADDCDTDDPGPRRRRKWI
jgi:hypothetical protein